MGKVKKELEENPVAEETVLVASQEVLAKVELNDTLYGVEQIKDSGWYEALRVKINIAEAVRLGIAEIQIIGEKDIKAIAVERCRDELDRTLDT